MTQTHTLALSIDASSAKRGSDQFTAAIAAVKKAVRELERDTSGAFTKLQKISPQVDVSGLQRATAESNRLATAQTKTEAASARSAAAIQRTALSAAAAMRTSTNEAARLSSRLTALGDASGVDKITSDLSRLQTALVNAQTPLQVRSARSTFADSANDLRRYAGTLSEQAAAEARAASSAAAHAASLDTLRAKYNPLFAASKAYETSLEEISAAERAGVISSQLATQARERAAAGLMAASASADQWSGRSGLASASTANLAANFNDIGVMLAAGQSPLMLAVQQGTQVSQVLNQMRGSGQSVLSALASGFLSMINPVSLVTVGVIAAGAAIFYWLTSGTEKTKSFTDSLSDANSAISAMRAASDALSGASLGSLAEGYGRVNEELRIHLERLQEVSRLESVNATRDLINSIESEITGGWITSDVDDVRIAFDTTNDRARAFLGMMQDIRNARTFEDQLAAVTKLRAEVESTTGGLGKAEGAAQDMLIKLVKSEDAAKRLVAAQNGTASATSNAAGAASGLSAQIGGAADEAARLLANLGSVPGALAAVGKSVGAQIAQIESQNRSLSIQLSEGLSGAAANRRVQLEDVVKAAGTSGQRISFDAVASQYSQIQELEAASKQQDALRDRLSEANKPAKGGGGGGGSRVEALGDEERSLSKLSKSMNDRIFDLGRENEALNLLISGQAETMEGAQMLADAQRIGGGMIDGQTAAMVRQYEAATKLNEALQRAAKDPVREWMDSVPGWTEAGQKIEMGAIDGVRSALSEMISTGKIDMESLGQSILGTIADVVADKATKELATMLGAGEGGGLGGVLGGLFRSAGDPEAATGDAGMSAALTTGGQTAGASISAAMVQAGQTVSTQLSAAMTQGGSAAGSSVQSGLATGATSVRTAATTGLAVGSTNIATASTTGGQMLGAGVVSGATAGAPILGAAVAGGGASGGGGAGGGGGIFGSIFSMVLGSLAEGGYANRPPAHASMPVAAFRGAPQYAEGTANTSGIPAILHPNEAVVPLSRGRKIPVDLGDAGGGGSAVVNNYNWSIQTPDADSFRRSQKQLAADAANVGNRAARSNG